MAQRKTYFPDDPLWYKDAIIYELHVKTFYDSDDNGIGDFRGLRRKLEYLENLGITAIWLLPFYPSPLKDDGYDIADYYNVHPDYGTLKDFRDFLKDAHQRGIRVITELVLNHTSDQHPWFQRARNAPPGSRFRNFYVWSETPEKYQDARIIFKDFEVSNWRYDPLAKSYFWHRFYSHQPDLNFDNPHVQRAVLKAIDFWFGLGVDGLRLDAVPYIFEREGTNCENLPETYEFLHKLRTHVDGKFRDKMLLAEANQWPEDAVCYFGIGNRCHMAFHFPLMPRMFMAIQMEDRFPIVDIFDQTPTIPGNCQWAIFLRNHDELTLEMVTDEERDYMYRIYAKDSRARINLGIRRRLAPLLENDRRRVELMNTLLLTLPGTPVIYYGDELGMGENYYLGDRDGVRTPMQWSADKNAGFSNGNPQRLYLPVIIDPAYHYETINVENQEQSSSSLLWWMRRFIGMRKRYKALGRGSIEFLSPDNSKVLAFIRSYGDENLLVVVNLSRHPQFVEFNLRDFSDCVPKEVFSGNCLSPTHDSFYSLTLGSYGYFCFELITREGVAVSVTNTGIVSEIEVDRSWERFFDNKNGDRLERDILPAYIRGRRWFGGKARQIQYVTIREAIPIGKHNSMSHMLLLEVQFTEGLPETYFLPLSFAEGEKAQHIAKEYPHSVVAHLTTKGRKGIIYDGVYDPDFCIALLSMVMRRHAVKGQHGEITAFSGKIMRSLMQKMQLHLDPHVLEAEQSNTSVLFGSELYLKAFRHCEEGKHPDLEISQFLTEWVRFPNVPAFAGGIEYRLNGAGEPTAIAIIQKFVPNQGVAWRYFLDALGGYFERVLSSRKEALSELPKPLPTLLDIRSSVTIGPFEELLGGGPIEMASLLGRRTAELHQALASADIRDFAPEPFSLLYQRSLYQSMQSLAKRVFQLLRKSLEAISDDVLEEAQDVIGMEKKILAQLRAIHQRKLSAMKTRVHGDFHLGQVLFTGKDFVIFDFEGEPARPMGERRLKRSPLVDVAGMVRSFHYACYHALFKGAALRPEDQTLLEPWADVWYRCIGGVYLCSYLETAKDAAFLPKAADELNTMLKAFFLEKAVYELGYELNNRPEWVSIPLKGIIQLMQGT